MKKPLRYMLSLVLMLALMLSMGTAAFADKTDSGLPVEYVSYGVGLSDAPGVDKHGLSDDDITIDGVSWRTDTTEEALHVHVLDLAAAKLLRCCTDEARELGLDYAKLYIENGLIHVKEDVPAEEAGGLKGKLDELTRAAVIGLVSGDAFDVGNGGEAKLQVKIATFVTLAAEETAAEQETVKSVLDVKGVGVENKKGPYGTTTIDEAATIEKGMNEVAQIERTTVFIIYGGTTDYYMKQEVGPLSAPDANAGTQANDAYYTGSNKNGWVGIANAEGDNNKYYIKVIFDGDNSSIYVPVSDLASLNPESPDFNGMLVEITAKAKTGEFEPEQAILADKILVSTDKTDDGIIMTINLKDETPTPEEIYDDNGKLKNDVPNYDGPTKENEKDSYVSYEPEEGKDIEAAPTSENTADVAVRDTARTDDPDWKKPDCN